MEKLSNNWTDRDQIMHTYADSSGNGHQLNKFCPMRHHEGFRKILGCRHFKNRENVMIFREYLFFCKSSDGPIIDFGRLGLRVSVWVVNC